MEKKTIWRVMCSNDAQSGEIFIDFSLAAESENFPAGGVEAHLQILMLRQKKNPEAKAFLPPLFLEDTGFDKRLVFADERDKTVEAEALVNSLRAKILLEYQDFRAENPLSHNSLDNTGVVIGEQFVDIRNKNVRSWQEEQSFAEVLRQRRREAMVKGIYEAENFSLPPE